jgi:hypothetical protein
LNDCGTLLRLSNTNMGMVLLWLGELMQQVQWAMVRLRLGAGEVSMVGRMGRMTRGGYANPCLLGRRDALRMRILLVAVITS